MSRDALRSVAHRLKLAWHGMACGGEGFTGGVALCCFQVPSCLTVDSVRSRDDEIPDLQVLDLADRRSQDN